MRARLAMGCLATVAVADYLIARGRLSWFQIGLVDEPAHVATALLLAPRPSRAYMLGSMLPDVDHLPLAFRRPAPGDPRPRTHSVFVVAGAAAVSRSAAAGMLAHFVRDLALEPGVPLLWPLTRRELRIPYAAYGAALIVAALRPPSGSAARSGVT